MEYLDFEIAIEAGGAGEYHVVVLQSPAGEIRVTKRFPVTWEQSRTQLGALHDTLAGARSGRDVVPVSETDSAQPSARELGQMLFEVLFAGDVDSLYFESLREARRKPDRGVRVKLRIPTAELASLPWELVFDPRRADFVALSRATPLVRYLELPNPPEPLSVTLPLRILGMIASPRGLPPLDVDREKASMEKAIAESRDKRRVDLTWLPGQTWGALREAMEQDGGRYWHVFHFIGHGGFDARGGEGYLALASEHGTRSDLSASGLNRLLRDCATLRLAVLNACEGATGSAADLFSSTAASLVRGGLPAVVSMQHEISDDAAIEFSREFYRTLAQGQPVDAAVAEARKAMTLALPRSVEWATPVLHMRSPDGRLFDVVDATAPAPPAPSPPPGPPPRGRTGVRRGWETAGAAVIVVLGIALANWLGEVQRKGVVPQHLAGDTAARHAAPAPSPATEQICTTEVIKHFADSIVGLAASYNQDDNYRIALVATAKGVVYELFYHAEAGSVAQPASNPNPIWSDQDGSGIVAVAGFYSEDDTYRHLVVATRDGKVRDYFYHPSRPHGETVLGTYPGVLDIAAFYNADDHYRVVLVATKDGTVREVYFQPAPPPGRPPRAESVIADYRPGNILHIAGTFERATQDRRLVTATTDGSVFHVLYNPLRRLHPRQVYHGNDAMRVAATGGSFFSAIKNNRLLRITGLDQAGQPCSVGVNASAPLDNLAVDYMDEGNLVYSTSDGVLHRVVGPPQ